MTRILKSKLRSGHNNKRHYGTVLKLYKKLDTIPEISTILKVVEQSELHEIFFHFDRDSIVDLEPTLSSKTRGTCKITQGCLYISGQQESQLVGALAHELTHLAMQVCYDNECNP